MEVELLGRYNIDRIEFFSTSHNQHMGVESAQYKLKNTMKDGEWRVRYTPVN